MDAQNQPVIQTFGLSKTYKQVAALKSLDLKVSQNSIFGFLGPNGAGKTTTIRLMLGLSRPTSGRGTVFGLDITRRRPLALQSRRILIFYGVCNATH